MDKIKINKVIQSKLEKLSLSDLKKLTPSKLESLDEARRIFFGVLISLIFGNIIPF